MDNFRAGFFLLYSLFSDSGITGHGVKFTLTVVPEL